jgi:lipopolysaccharide export system permease protein
MTIIDRYLSREFTKNFFLGLGAFSVIYLIVEFFERINAFMYNKASLPLMLEYFLNRTPTIIFQVAPASILLSTIVTLGLMAKHNEIVAIKSGGLSLWRITLPILGVVVILYFGLLGLNEYVVPRANQKARMIDDWVVQKKRPVATFKQSQLWIHSRQAIYNIQLYDPEQAVMEGVTLYRFDPNFQLIQRVDARSGRWAKDRWVFMDVSVTRFGPEGFPISKKYPELVLFLPETPGDFRIEDKKPDEMNYLELRDYVHKIETDGYKAHKYRSSMHACISFPFVGVIMAFLGIPLALRKERGSGIGLGVGISILISAAYLAFFQLGLELGKAGTLPPLLSAWLGNIIFALVGFYLFLSIRQ